jgi:hypothetical protein
MTLIPTISQPFTAMNLPWVKKNIDRIAMYLDVQSTNIFANGVLRMKLQPKDVLTLAGSIENGPYRFRLWKNCMGSIASEKGEISYEDFEKLMAVNESIASTHSPGNLGELMRDISRTFPSHPFFRKNQTGERMLRRILMAALVARADVGYCQGMNFVVGALILGRLPKEATGGLSMLSATDISTDSTPSASPANSRHASMSSAGPDGVERTNSIDVSIQKANAGSAKAMNTSVRPQSSGDTKVCSSDNPSEVDSNGMNKNAARSTDESKAVSMSASVSASVSGLTVNTHVASLPKRPQLLLFDSSERRRAEYDVFLLLMEIMDKDGQLGTPSYMHLYIYTRIHTYLGKSNTVTSVHPSQ